MYPITNISTSPKLLIQAEKTLYIRNKLMSNSYAERPGSECDAVVCFSLLRSQYIVGRKVNESSTIMARIATHISW